MHFCCAGSGRYAGAWNVLAKPSTPEMPLPFDFGFEITDCQVSVADMEVTGKEEDEEEMGR